MTMEGWTDVMYLTMKAVGGQASIYFVCLVVIGSFYVINLFLAVLWHTYWDMPDARGMKGDPAHAAHKATFAAGERAPVDEHSTLATLSPDLADEERAREHTRMRARAQSMIDFAPSPAAMANEGRSSAACTDSATQPLLTPVGNGSASGGARGKNGASGMTSDDLAHADSTACGAQGNGNAPRRIGSGRAPTNGEKKQAPPFSIPRKHSSPVGTDRHDNAPTSVPQLLAAKGAARQFASRAMSKFSWERFLDSLPFRLFVISLVCANTVVMALERHPMPDELAQFIRASNLVFTVLFTLEMILKLCVRGVKAYWDDLFDRFDGIVVLTAILELVLIYLFGIHGFGVQELRLLRLMRTLKLVRSWRSLRTVMRSLLASMASLQYLFLVLVLTLFVFAALGMQLFGGKLQSGGAGGSATALTPMHLSGRDASRDASLPTRNLFDSFSNSMITAFVVVSLEDWNDYFVVTSSAVGRWSLFYYLALLIIGNYLVLNLVVAVVIGGYVDAAEHQAREEADAAAVTRMQAQARGMLTRKQFDPKLATKEEVQATLAEEEKRRYGGCCGAFRYLCSNDRNHALLCFGPTHPLRRTCRTLVTMPFPGTPLTLTTFIVAIVAIASCATAIEACDFVEQAGDKPLAISVIKATHNLDILAVGLSLIEILLKCVAFGVFLSPSGYLRDGWNQLDAALVLATGLLLGWGIVAGNLITLRAIRLLKLFTYELRVVVRFSGVRQVVNLLVTVMPRVFNVMLVYMLFLVVFGILGVQLFSGRFASCVFVEPSSALAASASAASSSDASASITAATQRALPASSTMSGQHVERHQCTSLGPGFEWRNPSYGSFDSIGSACLLLFEVSALEQPACAPR